MQSLSGTMWTLVEASARDEEGREVPSPIGQHPMGFVVLEEERMLVAVADARPSLPPGAPARALLSYTGTYRFDGDELVTRADAASRPDMLTEQVWGLRFDGPTRLVATPRSSLPGLAAGMTFVWERVR